MAKILKRILKDNIWNITEAVIKEIIEDENPMESLLRIQEYGVEGWLIECLAFEKDCIKFFNKHYDQIEELRKYLQDIWNEITIPSGYSSKAYFAMFAFKHIAFDLYIYLIVEDL